MIKKLSLAFAALVLLASCSVKENRELCFAPVTVCLGGFTFAQER